ncbi:MAG: DUF4982 domain-containing protein [Oscillospiraceae bacterium]|nr:DUF4982 domain-containing protein [Oscillospiraceae bacterium]
MRKTVNINKDWFFKKNTGEIPQSLPTDWEPIDLPYTWNGTDGQDGGNDYFRGKGCFVKRLLRSDVPDCDECYIQLDGVNSSAQVYFNGEKIASHDGGYSTFRVRLPEINDENILTVIAENSPNDRVYPQMADFTFYGGIYRDVKLIGVPKNHFDLEYFGAPGITVTPVIRGDNAEIRINTYVKTETPCQIKYEILADSEVILTKITADTEAMFIIENVHLWNGVKDPYLYTARATLISGGSEEDSVWARFGCRSFEVDPQRGFILNGREYPLRGVSRHQDRPKIGNALKYEHHKEDIDLICEMGANTVRLAHYQHSQDFYDLCDEKGLVVWAEIPYISHHLPYGIANTRDQMTELICQNYNHPCIVTWGLSNEITMGGASAKGLLDNHIMLNELAHSLDKTRPTTLAVISTCGINEKYVHITDTVSYNHYFGWYGGNVHMTGPWFDRFHKKYPNRTIGLSEYGCEALNWHTSTPEQGDYTEEYQAYYHEEMIKQIIDRPYLWATHVWNMFDFAADARAEGGENGMNHKGLVTFDRKYKKDSFYAYKAWLSDEPFVHICGKRYVRRTEDKTKVTVYSNQAEVELFANGVSVGKQKKGKYPFFCFYVENIGKTLLTARAGDCADTAELQKTDTFDESYRMKEMQEVINWFEIDTPAGYYSVNDTIGSVISTFKGKLFMIKLAKVLLLGLLDGKGKKKSDGISIAGFKPNRNMLELAKGFTVKRVFVMLGGRFSKKQILEINAALNNIKKK